MFRHSLLALVFVFAFSAAIIAQPSEANKPAAKNVTNTPKTAKDAEAERVMKERRENAQSLLISLAADAVKFNDQILRARTQARIADTLWDADAERARTLFRNAWEAAEV